MALVVLSISSTDKPLAQSNGPRNLLPTPQNMQSAGPGNLVYVGDNVSTGAGIKIFRRDDMGRLTELATVPTGGKGLFDIVGFDRAPTGIFAAVDIGPWEHDANMIFNQDRSRLFVVNQGSDDLSVFNVSADGLTLTPVPGSPFKTGHVPASVGLAAFDTVIVVNKNDDPGGQKPLGKQGSVMTFKMASNGSLTPVPNSEIFFPTTRGGEGVFKGQTSTPSQVLVSEDGRLAFVNDFFAGMIRPFIVQPDGTLKPTKPFDIRSLGEAVLPANGMSFPFSLGLAIYPGRNILYTGLLFENRVAVFRFNPKNGKLTYLRIAENSGSTVCWFAISKSGKYMWTSNQASNSVSTYDVSDPENPREIQVVQFDGCGEPSQVAVDPNENWIHYVNAPVTNKCSQKDPEMESNMIHTLRIGPDGRLTEVSPPTLMPLPLGERAQGVLTR
jgi:6-phosphogluconolactonase (cycloisomerase 2 family)